jgi:hypothetical protein
MKAAVQPTLPQSGPNSLSVTSDQVYMTNAGAIPKLHMSDKLSYCTPKALVVLVRRAIRPSSASRMPAMNTAIAAST